MIAKRIIPCLDVRNARVVKGVNFKELRDMDDPVSLAQFYDENGADELVFYDITASAENRPLFTQVLEELASKIFIPLTVGGSINSISDFSRVLSAGADKVSVNSGALKNPGLIDEAAKKFGSQCVVLSVDAARVNGKFRVFARGGRDDTGRDALEWITEGQSRGAGELVLNSIDTDGVKGGFDIQMLAAAAKIAKIPIIASGGAGKIEDFLELFRLDGVDAGLAASIFHTKSVLITELKRYLSENGVHVRLENMSPGGYDKCMKI